MPQKLNKNIELHSYFNIYREIENIHITNIKFANFIAFLFWRT